MNHDLLDLLNLVHEVRKGYPGIAPASLQRAKQRIGQITRRNRGIGSEGMIRERNSFLAAWVTYFRHAACKGRLDGLDGWGRRKRRCVRLKQCKRTKPIRDLLRRQGVSERKAWLTAMSGKGWWRLPGTPSANQARSNHGFDEAGLVNLVPRYTTLQG